MDLTDFLEVQALQVVTDETEHQGRKESQGHLERTGETEPPERRAFQASQLQSIKPP